MRKTLSLNRTYLNETFRAYNRIYTINPEQSELGGVKMQSKRKRILTMLENGTITTDEALTLLENLSNSPTAVKEEKPKVEAPTSQQAESTVEEKTETANEEFTEEGPSGTYSSDSDSNKNKEQSTDEFLEDIRKDFAHVGDRFMQFMQTAVQKVKEFDFDSPFGQSVSFTQTLTKPADGIEEIILDIDHGKIEVHCTDEKEARAEFTVKALNGESEEAAREHFLEKILFVTDGEKLRLSSAMKMTQVNVELYIPRQKYSKLSTRLMNGSFKMREAEIADVRVKTANGKIDVASLTFQKAAFETANGSIGLKDLIGERLEAETLNGRVYIDGELQEIEAQSLSGHVVVTTTNESADKIEAKSMSGSVEIYIPVGIAMTGEIASNMGKLKLQLDDVDKTAEQEQILQRSIRFKKDVEGTSPLYIFGEAKTGSVLVCYNG